MHDSSGLGLRFDAGEDGNFGTNNDLLFNVVVRNAQGGASQKANRALTYRNTAVDNTGEDAEAGSSSVDLKICACCNSSLPPFLLGCDLNLAEYLAPCVQAVPLHSPQHCWLGHHRCL